PSRRAPSARARSRRGAGSSAAAGGRRTRVEALTGEELDGVVGEDDLDPLRAQAAHEAVEEQPRDLHELLHAASSFFAYAPLGLRLALFRSSPRSAAARPSAPSARGR